MASMLRGRTRHEFNEFKSHHHLPLMLNTIILLKMISPHLFRPSHVKYTSDMMTMFWQMVKQYCHRARRQMINVLVKTLSITHDYLNHRPSDAITLLTKHQSTLQSLMKTYHDQDHILPTLSSFQSIVMSSWSDSDAPRSFHTPALRPEQPIALYLDLLGRNQDLENQLLVLSDFDESSKRKIDDVTPFVGDLRRIFSKGRDPVARKQALSAAIRHARNHPQATRKLFLEDFISCLSRHSKNSDVDSKKLQLTSSFSSSVLSSIAHDDDVIACDVINFLPDITVLCREAAPRLLGTAFDAVVRGGRPNDSSANKSASLVLARSMWLLSGFAEEELLPKPATSKS
uniref:Uncharacterized protein n=1 Tax=Ciona savignyi TaxID=51511 RepID=H2Y9A7_CIOSA